MLWVLIRSASARRFLRVHTAYVFVSKKHFLLINTHFLKLWMKLRIYNFHMAIRHTLLLLIISRLFPYYIKLFTGVMFHNWHMAGNLSTLIVFQIDKKLQHNFDTEVYVYFIYFVRSKSRFHNHFLNSRELIAVYLCYRVSFYWLEYIGVCERLSCKKN